MRTNNSRVKNTIISVYFILIVMAIAFLMVFKTFTSGVANPFLVFISIALGFAVLFFVVHFISKYFEYDSDGLKVVVTNKGLLFSDKFNYRETILEFDKNDLYAYKFKNYFFYKTLTFYLKNKRGKKRKEVFNVTLVNRKKRRYIRQSLSKMVKANKKQAKKYE
ncbi:hypothetical protein [Psychroserpens sp. MEBiC05023]